MESKKIIAAALAATIAASVSPINVMGDNELKILVWDTQKMIIMTI